MARRGPVLGDTVLYSYLQKELQGEDLFLFQMITARLVTSLGVWVHPDTYARLPILLPHVVRDASARRSRGGVEAWATPDANGFLRDDNTLIKNLVKALDVESRRDSFARRRLGNGWVASHLWRERSDGTSASRHPRTNSFVPNLVWLPSTISLLSDRGGSFVQQFLQAISRKVYGSVQMDPPLEAIVEEAWSALPPPQLPEGALPDVASLNFFAHEPGWVERRTAVLMGVRDGLNKAARGQLVTKQELAQSRYREGVQGLPEGATDELRAFLSRYLDALDSM
jgi:hypothetical protein